MIFFFRTTQPNLHDSVLICPREIMQSWGKAYQMRRQDKEVVGWVQQNSLEYTRPCFLDLASCSSWLGCKSKRGSGCA